MGKVRPTMKEHEVPINKFNVVKKFGRGGGGQR